MPQRDGAPPSDWEERKDRATRRAIERMEEDLRAEYEDALEKIQAAHSQKIRDLEVHFVTYKSFALGIFAMLAAVFLLAKEYMAPTREAVSAGVQRMDAAAKATDERLARHEKEIERLRIDSNAVLRVTVDGKPRKQVQKEWESATGVPRIDAAP